MASQRSIPGLPPTSKQAKVAKIINADLDDDQVMDEEYQVNKATKTNRVSAQKPATAGKPPIVAKDPRKNTTTDTIARIKIEAEKSKNVLEKQEALIEQKQAEK